jgi:transposase
MSRSAVPLELTEAEKSVLESLIRSPQSPQGHVTRLKIVLLAHQGRSNREIARLLGVGLSAVGKWRGRFASRGMAGLRDLPRSGKPPVYDRETFRLRVFQAMEEPPPPGQAVWDGPSLARKLKASPHAVWRVMRKEGICLRRQRSWCVSTDPEFAAKAADIIGLYLNPPFNALVISVDEKPSIQALTRPTGYVQTSSGKVVRGIKSTYKRNGTLTLFAALRVATGEIIGQTTESKKRSDFRAFMDQVVAELPADKEVHVILDNLNTHKKNEDWLARYEGRVVFHFTPTSASWLNLVEVWFGLLTRKALRGANFPSQSALREAIEAFIAATNGNPRPFIWRKREVKGAQLRNTIVNLRN